MPSGQRYSGGWARKASAPIPAVPLKPALDPEHLDPTDNPDVVVGLPMWSETQAGPGMPSEYITDGYGTPVQAGGGPIDYTPDDPNFGPGAGHGQTIAQAQAVRTQWMDTDYGAVAARRWQTRTDRDGTPHLDVIRDVDYAGDSPATVGITERSGIGVPENDPYARTGQRQKRWWDRVIDMHWFDVSMRPARIRNARPVPEQLPGGTTQYDSPWPTMEPARVSPDAYVTPQPRRTPPLPWATADQSDGTAQTLAGNVNGFGLSSWGL